MANRRMLSNTLGGSKKIAALLKNAGKLADFCQVIYMIGLPWTDDLGQITADPWEWKFNFFRVSPKSEKDFKKALELLITAGLFEISICQKALKYVNFNKFQTLKGDRTPKNDFPGIQWKPPENTGFPKEEVKLSEVKEEIEEKDIARSEKKSSLQADISEEKIVLKIPLVKKDREFCITQTEINQWRETFPAVDVLQNLREIRQWNIDHPARRKTVRGIKAHITHWLSKEQDKGNTTHSLTKAQQRTLNNAKACEDWRPE